MKVFLAGGTGALGTHLLPLLTKSGYSVTAIARSEEKAKIVDKFGGKPIKIDLFSESEVKQAVKGHDIVINITTNIPKIAKAKEPNAWEMNDKIRKIVSKNLAQAALEADAKKLIQESITFFYANNGDIWVDEESTLNPNPWTKSALEAESNVLALKGTKIKPVVLRFAGFYGPGSDLMPTLIQTGRYWISPFFGIKEHYQPMIHLHDAATAVIAAINAEEGIYNIADDEPLTRKQLDQALAKALGKIGLIRIPTFVVSKSSPLGEFIFKSVRVSNQKFKSATDWKPEYKSAYEGLKAYVDEMKLQESKSL